MSAADRRAAAPGGARAASRAGCNCKYKSNPCGCSAQGEADCRTTAGKTKARGTQLVMWREVRIGNHVTLAPTLESQAAKCGEVAS